MTLLQEMINEKFTGKGQKKKMHHYEPTAKPVIPSCLAGFEKTFFLLVTFAIGTTVSTTQ